MENMMTKKVFIQVQATKREREMLAEIAEHRRTDMSKVVREWIWNAHKRMVVVK
jgi:hypothetical protein